MLCRTLIDASPHRALGNEPEVRLHVGLEWGRKRIRNYHFTPFSLDLCNAIRNAKQRGNAKTRANGNERIWLQYWAQRPSANHRECRLQYHRPN